MKSKFTLFKKWKILYLFFAILISSDLSASHFRGGDIQWKCLPGNTIEFTVTSIWRADGIDGDYLNFGDGTGSGFLVGLTTFIHPTDNWAITVKTITHTYSSSGTYTAYISSCCRISALPNGWSGDGFRMEAVVIAGGSCNNPPSLASPAFINVSPGNVQTCFQLNASDPEGDPITFSIANFDETRLSPDPSTVWPQPISLSPSGLICVNPTTMPGAPPGGYTNGQLIPFVVKVEDNNGNGTIPGDILLRISTVAGVAPTWDYGVTPADGGTLNFFVGVPGTIPVEAEDADAGNTVNILPIGIPLGASWSPLLPNTSNPNATTLSWTPTLSDVGSHPITLIAEDNTGAQAPTNFTIVVQSCNAPVASCMDVTVSVDNMGLLTLDASQVDDGSTADCGLASLVVLPDMFDCTDVGTSTMVTLTITDTNGDSDACMANVTISDEIPPTPVCDLSVSTTLSGTTGLVNVYAFQMDDASLDNCTDQSDLVFSYSGTDMNDNLITYDCSHIGFNDVSIWVWDEAGNVSEECFALLEVVDNTAPNCIVQDITIDLDHDGEASIVVGDIDNGTNDLCGVETLSISPTDFDCSNVGPNTVTLTAVDSSGNTSMCDATVTVQDVEPPHVHCKDITIQLDALGAAMIDPEDIDSDTEPSEDECGIASYAADITSFGCADVGDVTVTLTVTDVNSNTATCTSTVTVQDMVAPMCATMDITIQLDAAGMASIAGSDIDNGSSDACGIATLTASPNGFDCSNIGANTVTLTVTDNNGNTSTCDATVTVEDDVNPIVLCQDITVSLDALGMGTISPSDVDDGSSDNCSLSLSVGPTSVGCSPTDFSLFTLIGDHNGHTYYKSNSVFTWVDAYNDAITYGGNLVSIDNATENAFVTDAVETVWIGLTDDDAYGTSEGNFVWTTGESYAYNNWNVGEPNDLGGEDYVHLYTSGTWNDWNTTAELKYILEVMTTASDEISVVLIGVDGSGNLASCLSTATIQDNVAPDCQAMDITIQLDAMGVASIDSNAIENGSTDACGIDSLALSKYDFTCADVGDNTVTMTVTDNNGNTSTCDAIVTVEDNVAPDCQAMDITIQLDVLGVASIDSNAIEDGSMDACGIDSLALSKSNFTCADVGANTVTMTVTDNNGNTSTCDATVTVEDNVKPDCQAMDITVVLDALGNYTVQALDIDNGSTDACGIASYEIKREFSGFFGPPFFGPWGADADFNCNDVGTPVNVKLRITDNNNNKKMCTAMVTVLDETSPFMNCQDNIVVSLNSDGEGGLVGINLLAWWGIFDACGIDAILVDGLPIQLYYCSDVGFFDVLVQAYDVSGNVTACTVEIEVRDQEAPDCQAQDITVYLDAAGMVSILPTDIDNGSSDNCPIDIMTLDISDFTCADVAAPVTVTLTVLDVNGNDSQCTADVTVIDTIVPVCLTTNITAYLDAAGTVTIDSNAVNGGSTDACGIASIYVSPASFTCAEEGMNTVTQTVTDNNGNVSTCTAVVTVTDTLDPICMTTNIIVQLDAMGVATIDSNAVNDGSSDNCGIQEITVSPSSFTCSNVGAVAVTQTVLDIYGNTSTCTAIVTVEDIIDPTAICMAHTVILDASGAGSLVAADINDNSNDACGIASMSASQTTFGCGDVGDVTVTLTVTDNNGNTGTCDATVTVVDMVPPVAICQDITVALDANGDATITPGMIDNGSNDACGIADLCIGRGVVTSAFAGELTASDPTFNFVDDILVNPCFFDPLIFNGCCEMLDGLHYYDQQQFTISGSDTYTFTLNDINGDVDFNGIIYDSAFNPVDLCQNIIYGDDDSAGGFDPQIVLSLTMAPGDYILVTSTYYTISGFSGPNPIGPYTWDITSAGGGTVSAFECDPSLDYTCTDLGDNTVTLCATDVNGNVSYCSSTVTIEDVTPPVANCQDVTVYLDAAGDAMIDAEDLDNVSTDACGPLTFSADDTAFDCADTAAGVPVTLTVTDGSGNSSTCASTVTVLDTIDPVAICKDITVQLDFAGAASIVGTDIDNGSNDACGILSLDAGMTGTTAFDCSHVGPNTITLIVTDNNGNTSTCTSTVTVEDNVAPLVNCINTVEVPLNSDGNGFVTMQEVIGAAYDACGIIDTIIIGDGQNGDVLFFDCDDIGIVPVTIMVTDANGNVEECNTTVNVKDEIVPTMVCQTLTIYLDANGVASIDSNALDNGSTDNCAIVEFSNSQDDFDCSHVAGLNLVTLTATDQSGNSNSCSTAVMVMDTIDPVAICQDITVQLDANGNAMIVAADVDNGSNDACGILGMSVSPSSFTCAEAGANTVTLTVTDTNLNTSTCTATVTVEDNVAPAAVCMDITVQLDALGVATIDSNAVDGGSTDACGIAEFSVSPNSFTCAEAGANPVILTVTDIHGNVSTCSATVTVEDNVAPVANCMDITVQLDANGDVTITGADVNNGSSDACGIASMTVSPSSFTCTEEGDNLVTLTVTDIHGNVNFCSSMVTVEDNVAPVATCMDITVQLDANGDATIAGADVNNGSSDACGIASMTVSPSSFTCTEEGDNLVTLTITDNNGNTSTCTSTVTVEDNVAPQCSAMDFIVQLDANGDATITAADVNDGSSDACGIASMTVSPSSFTCAEVGDNLVTLTITDNNGNTSTCTSTVTVEDNEAPTAICKNIDVYLDAAGNATIADDDIDDGSDDACGIATYAASQISFDCSHVGPNSVTLTVTDVNGNANSCTSTVTVIDTIGPVLVCPMDIVVNTLPSDCNQNVLLPELMPTDVCTGSNVTYVYTAPNITFIPSGTTVFALFPVGDTEVTATATDAYGNESECTFNITVIDNVDPSITGCGDIGDITVTSDIVQCGSNVTWDEAMISANDNCTGQGTGVTVSSSHSSGDLFPVGTTTVTYTATDFAGNTATCSFDVTVIANMPEADFTYIDASLVVDFDDASADATSWSWDFDDGNTSTDQNPNHLYAAAGTYTVCLTASEICGNSDTYCEEITLVDMGNLCIDEIDLEIGWNLISFDVAPMDSTIVGVFGAALGTSIDYISAYDNGALSYDPTAPVPMLNSLQNITRGFGYWVLANQLVTLQLTGECLDPAYKKPLDAGWNLISYIPIAPQPPALFFSGLGANLEYVSTYSPSTGSLVYDPSAPFPLLNTLTQMENGWGYWVKVGSAAPTWLKSGDSSSSRDGNKDEWGNAKTNLYDFLTGTVTGLESGDIVDVINDNDEIVVQLEVIQGKYLMTTPLYGDDTDTPDEIDGLLSDERLRFVYGGVTSDITITFDGNQAVHKVDLDFEELVLGVENVEELKSDKISISPNPFINSTTLAIEVATASDYDVKIIDASGRVASQMQLGYLTEGLHEVTIDRDNLANGLYNVVVQSAKFGSFTRIPVIIIQ